MGNAKTCLHRTAAFGIAVVVAFTVSMSAGVGLAHAGTAYFPLEDITVDKVALPYDKNDAWWNGMNFKTSKKLTQVKSSNPKVLKVVYYEKHFMSLKTMKPGKATLTFKLNGKKKTVSVTVRKYVNPFKKYKVGSKNVASQYKKGCNVSIGLENPIDGITGKISITPKKNWKIKAIKAYTPGTDSRFKTVANKSELPEATTTVIVRMVNEKTGIWERCLLYT